MPMLLEFRPSKALRQFFYPPFHPLTLEIIVDLIPWATVLYGHLHYTLANRVRFPLAFRILCLGVLGCKGSSMLQSLGVSMLEEWVCRKEKMKVE
jgi:hypothetical protein